MDSSTRLEVHGHRGCRGLRPENTLPAFLHAIALGVDVLEMDVVISGDSQVVVSHEPWLNPAFCLDAAAHHILPDEGPAHNLYRMGYDDISRCDCGILGHPDFPEQLAQPATKPLLRAVLLAAEASALRLHRSPMRYSVEIKSSPEGDDIFHPAPSVFLDLVVAELVSAQVLARTTLLCFDVRLLRLARQRYPGLATCLLIEDSRLWPDCVAELGFIPTTFGPNFTTVAPAAVVQLRTLFPTLRLVPWTVNFPADVERLRTLGVDGFTTDYPNRFL